MLPAPIVLPSAHVPVLGAVMVVRRLLMGWGWPGRASTPLVGIAEVVDASDAYREWLFLLASARAGSWATLVCS
jgi:hypothetical protein